MIMRSISSAVVILAGLMVPLLLLLPATTTAQPVDYPTRIDVSGPGVTGVHDLFVGDEDLRGLPQEDVVGEDFFFNKETQFTRLANLVVAAGPALLRAYLFENEDDGFDGYNIASVFAGFESVAAGFLTPGVRALFTTLTSDYLVLGSGLKPAAILQSEYTFVLLQIIRWPFSEMNVCVTARANGFLASFSPL